MRRALHAPKTVLALMMVVSMLLMSACDNTPATPVPSPTTVQSVAPTATAQQSSTDLATPATTGQLGGAKPGTITRITRSSPKGDLANRSFAQAKHDTPFEVFERGTPTPTEVEPTPTEGPSVDGVPEDWAVILDSDFSEGDPGTWLTGEADGFSSILEDGKMVMTAEDGIGFYNWAEETDNWTDGYVMATFEMDGPGVVGLSARVSSSGGVFNDVVCIISASAGNYACYTELEGDDEKVAGGRSSAVKKTGVNELALLGIGEEFTFIINGKTIKTFTVEGIEEGSWGTYVGSPPGETTSGMFERILFMGPGGDPDEPTVTPEPVDDTTATPTPGSGDETVILSTDFSEDGGTWFTGGEEGFSISVTDGELVAEISTPQNLITSSAEEILEVGDARIEATLRIEDSAEENPGWVGVSARSQEFSTNHEDLAQIFCGISTSGAFTCDRLSMAGNNTVNFKEVLHGQTDSIDATGENTISLTGKGNRWTFEINGTKVGSFTDNSVKEGAWGVLVLAGDEGTTGFFSKIEVFER
jgi:hypothetical protein